MVEQPAVVFGHLGEGIQPLSRHRLVPGSNPGGGTKTKQALGIVEMFFLFLKILFGY